MGSEVFNSLTTPERAVAKATSFIIHRVRLDSVLLVRLVLVGEDPRTNELPFCFGGVFLATRHAGS